MYQTFIRLASNFRLYADPRKTWKWRKLRSAHLKANPRCVICCRPTANEVHHVRPVHVDPDRSLDPDNLASVCSGTCHLVWCHGGNYRWWVANLGDVRHMLEGVRRYMVVAGGK